MILTLQLCLRCSLGIWIFLETSPGQVEEFYTTAHIPYREKYLLSVTTGFSDIKMNQNKGRTSVCGVVYSTPKVSLDLFLVCTFDYLCSAVLTEGSRNHIFVLTASLPQQISPPLWLSLLYALASFAGFFHFSWDSSVWISLTTSSSEANPQADSASWPDRQQFSRRALAPCWDSILTAEVSWPEPHLTTHWVTTSFLLKKWGCPRTWKHPKSPSMDKEDVVRIHSGIVLIHKKERNCAICRNMEGPRDCHTEWSQKEKQISYIYTHRWNIGKW